MRTIKMNLKKVVGHFGLSMMYLLEVLVIGFILIYRGMNGHFGRRKLKEPYIYIWRLFTWGVFVWVVFNYVCVPFFKWWDRTFAYWYFL